MPLTARFAPAFAYLDPGGGDTGIQAVSVVLIVVGALVVLALVVLLFRFLLRSERAARDRRPKRES